ncbi:TPR domain protein [Apiospora arundinis]|uniref:TPR domain protein n=1 Tax=Apiospora arundinis TaxID=335852 RepID=A0ABR2HTK2_9PEZI
MDAQIVQEHVAKTAFEVENSTTAHSQPSPNKDFAVQMEQLHLNHNNDYLPVDATPSAEQTAMSQADVEADKKSSTMVEVRSTGTMGLGLFATQDIPRGTRILSEEPLIHLPDPVYRRDLIKGFCNKAMKLSRDQIECLSRLHCDPEMLKEEDSDIIKKWYQYNSVTDAEGKELKGKKRQESRKKMLKWFGIFNANSSRQISDNRQEGRGVFCMFSRINHACVPNARYGWNETIKRFTVHVNRGVAKDEEIYVSYIPLFYQDREERAEVLKGWGFECGCKACRDPASERRWKQMSKCHLLVESYIHGDIDIPRALLSTPLRSVKEVLAQLDQLTELMIEEGLVTMELTKMYRTCSQYCWTSLDDMDKAIEYAEKALEVERCLIGPETEHLRENYVGCQYWLAMLKVMKLTTES